MARHISIDDDIVLSLYGFVFSDLSDKCQAASNRAYRDLARTINFPGGISKSCKNDLKKGVARLFKSKIGELLKKSGNRQRKFRSVASACLPKGY